LLYGLALVLGTLAGVAAVEPALGGAGSTRAARQATRGGKSKELEQPVWSTSGKCYEKGCGVVEDERDCCGGSCCSDSQLAAGLDGVAPVASCDSFDLVSQHMIMIGILQHDLQPTVQQIAVVVPIGANALVACADGYEPERSHDPTAVATTTEEYYLACDQVVQPAGLSLQATTDLRCAPKAAAAAGGGSDATTKTVTGPQDRALLQGAFVVGGCIGVVCLLGAAVVFRRQKRKTAPTEGDDDGGSRPTQRAATRAGRDGGGGQQHSIELNEMACQTVPQLEDDAAAADAGQLLAAAATDARWRQREQRQKPQMQGGDDDDDDNDTGMSVLSWGAAQGYTAVEEEAQYQQEQEQFLPWVVEEEPSDSSSESSASTALSPTTTLGSSVDELELGMEKGLEMGMGAAVPLQTAGQSIWTAAASLPLPPPPQQQQQQQPAFASPWWAAGGDPTGSATRSALDLAAAVDQYVGVGDVGGGDGTAAFASPPAAAAATAAAVGENVVGVSNSLPMVPAPAPAGATAAASGGWMAYEHLAPPPPASLPSSTTISTTTAAATAAAAAAAAPRKSPFAAAFIGPSSSSVSNECCPVEGCGFRNGPGTRAHTWSMARHLRTHTGERPFVCNHPGCGYRAGQRETLARHALKHKRQQQQQLSQLSGGSGGGGDGSEEVADDKPFKCPIATCGECCSSWRPDRPPPPPPPPPPPSRCGPLRCSVYGT
jgi:hypothetical protein